MNFRLLNLLLWTLPLLTHSHSAVSTHIPYMTERNDTEHTTTVLSSSPTVSSPLLSSQCRYQEENGLAIFCRGVDIVELAPNIPNDTVHLEIIESPLPKFTKPLLSHLHSLRYLKLNHNAHKYVTSKAFQGLHNLEELDLSFNDIIVLSKAFAHTPNLKFLNLTSNQIIKIGTIAAALSHLNNFQNLSLNHNVRIRGILRDELMPFNSTNLTQLALFNTTIIVIEEGAFKPLRNLKVLELSVSYLNEIGFRNVTVDLREIEVLFIKGVQFQKGLPYDALSLLGNTSIKELYLNYNYFPFIDKFPPIATLTTLEITSCSIKGLTSYTFTDLPNLQNLALSGNLISLLPQNVFTLPKLKYLSLKNQKSLNDVNMKMTFPDYIFKDATDLLQLDLRNVRTDGNIRRFAFYGLRKLEAFFLSSCGIVHIEDYAFETMDSLEFLLLKNNDLSHLSSQTFAGLRKLKTIVLMQNKIKFSGGHYPFQSSPLLSLLYLSDNEIVEIPAGMFSGNNFLKKIVLSGNRIVAWNFTTLAPGANVSILLLSKNKITHITPSMVSDFLRVSGTLDVTENPFNCTACGMKDFQRFINESNVSLYYTDTGTYTCSWPEDFQGKSILSVDIPMWHCILHEINMAIFAITILLSVMIPVTLISVFCYVFRWYIRYWLFHLKATLKERRHSKNDHSRHYCYDAFVSYNASDTPWVISTLIPALEKQEPRFRLCIHERDFLVGRMITDNILDAIEESRKVILLLSESFVKSEWCLFELHLAQHKLFDEKRDVLVLVKLKNIDKKLYTKNLKYLEKTRPCLTWTDSSIGQKLFWDKLRKILGKASGNSPEVMQC